MNAISSYLFSVVLIALAFVAWQALAKFSEAPSAWLGPIVLFGSLIGALVFGWRDMATTNPDVTWSSVFILLGLGLINGVAIYYNAINLTNESINVGTYLMILTVLMAVFAPFINAVFTRTLPSLWQFAAIGTGALTIYLAGK
ncbi:MAG: hypothetical protein HGB08_00150 [Candidatus Moranbacteria bacterium]|nr:hypothetical protein [Candidatus Moranbacteria bacterium]